MKKNITLSTKAIVGMLATQLAVFTQAANAAQCGKVTTAIDYGCDPNANPITSIILGIINFLSAGVGIAVVIGIIFGGVMYSASDGDPGKVKQAKDIIINAIIALFLFLFLFAAVNFLVPGGLFN